MRAPVETWTGAPVDPLHNEALGMAVVDHELRCVAVNEMLAALHGRSIADALGRPIAEALPAFTPAMEPFIRRVLADGTPIVDVEVQGALSLPGKPQQWLACYYPVRSRSGLVIAVDVLLHEPGQTVPATMRTSETAQWDDSSYLQLVVDAAEFGYWEWNIQNNQVLWGGQHEHLFGLQPGTFSGTFDDFLRLVHPDDRDYIRRSIEHMHDDSTLYGVEFRIVWPDGSIHWMASRGRWIMARDDQQPRLLGIVADVTERKRAEEAERAARNRSNEALALLDTLVTSAPVGLAFWDTELRYQRLNRLLAEMNGLPVEAHLGHTMGELLPDLAATIEPLFRRILETGEPIIDIEIAGTTLAAPGQQRYWLASYYPVWLQNQQIVGIGGVVTDITERKRTDTNRTFLAEVNSTLADSLDLENRLEQLAHLIVGTLADWCVIDVVDADGTVRHATTVHADPAKAALVQQLKHFLPEAHTHSPVARTLQAGTAVLIADIPDTLPGSMARDAEHLRVLRELAPNSMIVVPLLAHGRCFGALTLVRTTPGQRYGAADLALAEEMARRASLSLANALLYATEQRARVEAEAAVRVRDELFALVSHDLKSPLTVILGQAHLAQRRLEATDRLPVASVVKSLEVIRGVVTRMNAQIDELLDIARLRAGQALALQSHHVDLVALARRLTAESQQLTARHQIVVETSLQELTGTFDAVRLERVLHNLLDNAIKYSPQGGAITVTVDCEEDEEGGWVVLQVRDQGLGIPPAELPTIFERFKRASNVTGRITGTGLGLSSARQIVEQHGGSITVSSTVGQGTTFTVRLPMASELCHAVP